MTFTSGSAFVLKHLDPIFFDNDGSARDPLVGDLEPDSLYCITDVERYATLSNYVPDQWTDEMESVQIARKEYHFSQGCEVKTEFKQEFLGHQLELQRQWVQSPLASLNTPAPPNTNPSTAVANDFYICRNYHEANSATPNGGVAPVTFAITAAVPGTEGSVDFSDAIGFGLPDIGTAMYNHIQKAASVQRITHWARFVEMLNSAPANWAFKKTSSYAAVGNAVRQSSGWEPPPAVVPEGELDPNDLTKGGAHCGQILLGNSIYIYNVQTTMNGLYNCVESYKNNETVGSKKRNFYIPNSTDVRQ